MNQIVGVKFEDKYHREGGFSGRQYSYFAGIPLKKGDIVFAPTKYGEGKALVTAVDLPEETIAGFRGSVKTIEKMAPTDIDKGEDSHDTDKATT